jgi:O-antigen ligase
MWQDHKISGVGIGMFPIELRNYPNPKYAFLFRKGLVAHNMYISMLAETGIIGFILFIALIFSSLINLWKASRINDAEFKPVYTTWFIVFIVMLLGGLTKTDQVDKLLWLTMGVSVFANNQIKKKRKIAHEEYGREFAQQSDRS